MSFSNLLIIISDPYRWRRRAKVGGLLALGPCHGPEVERFKCLKKYRLAIY